MSRFLEEKEEEKEEDEEEEEDAKEKVSVGDRGAWSWANVPVVLLGHWGRRFSGEASACF